MKFTFTKEEKSWILYDCANSAYSLIIVTAILPVYFKFVAGNAGVPAHDTTAYWGYVSSFSTLIISILAPLLGSLGDYLGNKKRFFRYSLWMGVIMTGALFFVPTDQWQLLLFTYTLSHVGYQAANLFYDAFITDVTNNERNNLVSSYGFGIGYIGSALLFIVAMLLINTSAFGLISSTQTIRLVFIMTTLWWLAFSIPMLRNVEQHYGLVKPRSPLKESCHRILETFKKIRKYKQVIGFMIAYFFFIDGVDTIITMATAFGVDMGVKTNTLLLVLLVLNIVVFPCTLVYGWLAQKYGTKIMLLTAIAVYFFICFYALFMKTVLDFWILGLLVGSSQGGIQALSRAYFARIIPKKQANEFFGFYNIFGKFSTVLGPILFSITTQLTGYSQLGIASLALLFLLGGFFMLRLKEAPITQDTKEVKE
ncbi:MFS transporter [Liquorilactobacillus oeni]|uniref:Permease, major facilitator superfamily protein n=1 Tax=Liquorilactobacillus oeni DSM 19972 TaxID=1423777 RepID=A0A0R1M973_9LACO|nr:MFS transporter [Liquorilactobacillus oeni]KRL04481.1 permease, major facilitator superfamily protein [Liquorilactobacillus oeni DSM 19972]